MLFDFFKTKGQEARRYTLPTAALEELANNGVDPYDPDPEKLKELGYDPDTFKPYWTEKDLERK